MKKLLQNAFFWMPRIVSILFILFAGLYTLHVSGEDSEIWESPLMLLIHLIPAIVLALILIVSWRWEWIGGVLYGMFGVCYLSMVWDRFPLSVHIIISGPLLMTSFLFWLSWLLKDKIHGY